MRPRDRNNSRRHKQKQINRQSRQLVARVPKRFGIAHRVACQSIVRKFSGRQAFRAMRTERGQWFFNGERTISLVNWNGALINRKHARSRGKQITIAGIAFPVKLSRLTGKRFGYGVNKNPTYAMMLKRALMGDEQAEANVNDYIDFWELHNAKIDSAERYYEENNKYHRIYNPHGLDSRFREVK